MPLLIKTQIQTKIANICFSDNSKASERASEIIIKGKEAGFALDINGIALEEAQEVRNHIINELENPHISTFQKLNRITEWQQENSDESIYVPNLFGGGLIKDW